MNPMPPSELASHLTGRAVEAFSLWADANQRILRELVELSTTTAKEGVRLYAEIQSSAVEAMKESQSYLQRRQSELSEAPRDPMTFYQKGVIESVEGTQHGFRLFETTAQAMTRSAERLQVKAEQAGTEIQATVTQLSARMKSLYAPIA
jgi:hypothetical protein